MGKPRERKMGWGGPGVKRVPGLGLGAGDAESSFNPFLKSMTTTGDIACAFGSASPATELQQQSCKRGSAKGCLESPARRSTCGFWKC